MSWARRSGQVRVLLVVLVTAGCADAKVEGPPPRETPPGGTRPAGPGAATPGGSSGSAGAPGFVLPESPPGGAPNPGSPPGMGAPGIAPPAAEMTCAAQAFTPEKVPVDVQILLDSSLSMGLMAGTSRKWDRAIQAINTFLGDPKSAGLGVGLTFYPNRTPTNVNTCRLDYYTTPAVTIAPLPMNQPTLASAISARALCCDTPTRPGMEGALSYLRSHAATNPDRRPILLLITDGLPNGCGPGNTVEGIAEFLTATRSGTPSIATYAIGVFAEMDRAEGQRALNSWAQAGGSGTPFVLSATEDLGAKLLDALNEIRGAALACQFAVPTSVPGIDFSRVNVRVQTSAGMNEILYVASADRCHPVSGGWYYDVDPATSTAAPSRVIICDTSCGKYRTDAAAKVDLLFGCKTRTID
jgi:hypothetical protein